MVNLPRPLKTRNQIISDGFNAEGALIFLSEFMESEKRKQYTLLINCPEDELRTQRQVYKYICSLEEQLRTTLALGIEYATSEQSD